MTTATPSSGGRRTSSQSTSRSKSQSSSGRTQRNRTSRQTQSAQKSQPAEKSQTSTTAKAQSSGAQSSGSRSRQQSGGSTWHLPFVTAQFHAPEMHVPGKEQITSVANTAVEQAGSAVNTVREHMPPREHTLFYGALGGAAALSVIEWPVALAIGVGTALVNRGKSDKTTSSAR